MRRILFAAAALCLLVPAVGTTSSSEPGLRGPSFVWLEEDSQKLIVLCEKTGTLARVHPVSGDIEKETPVGEGPFDLARHPHLDRWYVSLRTGQEVVEIDAGSLTVLRRFPLRGDPTGAAVSGDGSKLYVGVHSLDQVMVIDLESWTEIKRLPAGNGPHSLRRSPVDGHVYVTNLLTNPIPPDQPCELEITVIEETRSRVMDRVFLTNANVGREIAFTGDGSLAIAAISRPKNLIPMVQVARGWVVTNGFVVFSPQGAFPPVQLLVDLPHRGYSDAHGVAVMPGDQKFYLTTAGADMVLAVDLLRVKEVMEQALAGEIPGYSDHLGLSRRYVTARIPVGANPRSLSLSTDGQTLYVANRLDDTISVINTAIDKVERTLTLGAPPAPDALLAGERLFHNADRTFQRQFVCVSCHPDGGFDALQYDLEPDDLGKNILDNRTLRGIVDTDPFKWVGTNPDIATQCGTRTAKWIVRTGWLNSKEVMELATYIHSIPTTANPYQSPSGKLTTAQKRGKLFFERTTLNDGTPIPERDQCHFCHSGPFFTNRQRFDVGTTSPTDTKIEFDTAHLNNIFESAPYLHDGRAATLEEIWTLYNPDDKHGISSDWTKQQLNDLVEYLNSIGAPPQEIAP